MEDFERIGPVPLRLIDPHQVIERRLAVLARGRKLLEEPLGAIHKPGAEVIQRQRESGLVMKGRAPLLAQAGVDRNRAIDLAAAAEEAAERELDLRRIAVRLRHAREDLDGMIEAVVDEVI